MPDFFLKSSLIYILFGADLNVQQKPLLLVVAQSARMLSQMAVNLGFSVIAIDCYADVDTCGLALETRRVTSLAVEHLRPAVADLFARYADFEVLYGSGFELYPESLSWLAEFGSVLGNNSQVFESLLNKAEFFSALDDLAIDYPPSSFKQPDCLDGWLFKPMAGCGGVGIGHAISLEDNLGRGYWQRYLPGGSFSVLFLADGSQGRILGWNRQSTSDREGVSFQFAGLHNRALLPARQRRQMQICLDKLLSRYPLQGLGSLDFMVDQDRCYLLEINARIPASAQLYPKQALATHIQVCRGKPMLKQRFRSRPKGLQLLYADRSMTVPTTVVWPSWAADLPACGAIIERGQPICSIIGGGKNASQVLLRLRQRQQIIETLLNPQTF